MVEERNLLDYVYVLLKWRWLIFFSVASVSLAAAGISLLLPKRWTAETTLLPPEAEGVQPGLSLLLGGSAIPPNLGRLAGGSQPAERLLAMLGSRLVLGALVDRFALIDEYGAPNRDLAIQYLDQDVRRELEREGTLTIAVTAASPSLAAELANALAAELDAVNRHYKSLQARLVRQFLEERLELVQQEFVQRSQVLREFQEAYGLVDVPAQTGAAVEVIKGVTQQLTLLEVQLGVSRQLLSAEHEERQRLAVEVEQFRVQLRRLVGELDPPSAEDSGLRLGTMGPALLELPELIQQYAWLALELKLKEGVVTFLGTRLEEMRYQEAQDTPTLLVLDPATPPESRSAPRRTLLVAIAAGISLLISLLLAFLLEALGQLSVENRRRIQAIRHLWRSAEQ